MLSSIFMPCRVICGENAVLDSADIFESAGKSCLIVSGGTGARASGALSDAESVLEKVGIKYDIFDKIGANPLISVCCEAGAKARESAADFIIGIGGGSALDAAKAAAIYAANSGMEPLGIYSRAGCAPALKTILIGTTAGTGSEVTGVSVLTNDETGVKKSISGADCYASASLCDYRYTGSVPYAATVSTALDAFAHAVEGFFTKKCVGPLALFAQKAIADLYPCLKELCKSKALPDSAMRKKLYYASLYAGLVINTCGTAFPHPLGYVLTENFGIAHGAACAAFMPAFLKRCERFAPEKLHDFEGFCGESTRDISACVRSLTDLSAVLISRQSAAYFGKRWETAVPKNFTASPGGLTREEAEDILASINQI